jgi:aminopeptidase N
MLREGNAPLIQRADYTAPAYWIRSVDLCFDLDPAKTMVISRMQMVRNAAVEAQPLRLHGEGLNLTRVLVNNVSVSFRHEAELLVIENLPEGEFLLEIRNTCAPNKNTQLSGLYASGAGLFTQCEAEGFRRITFFLDRPDVMAVYTVTLRADKAAFPVLLSNGDLQEEGALDGGRHFAKWHDPHPKPSYLFALVAADLVARQQTIRTRAGLDHLLQIYVRRGDLDKTEHAMNSLMASIAWDEARFNLPLDLKRFMVVAVPDFNMGAMENKGLNIFNTKYVLASPHTATDADYANVESVVAHEYFHNWTGNRITCRDWFQLSLKEGLTVFRDQEFSLDMAGSESARAVKRIEDVKRLREVQFPEDGGTMAHPVRPDAYQEINNFYTATVYEKGAEVVRMMHTLVGRAGFARGMALYVERFDGQAVTCDDFAQAMADANPQSGLARHLVQFKLWYAQAGTPKLTARGRYDAPSRTYTLGLEQANALGGVAQPAQIIPVAIGLVARDGRALPLQLEGEASAAAGNAATERVLVLQDRRNFFTFVNVDSEPVPSLLRGFSAPVVLIDGLNDNDLLTLLQHDPDPFNRCEAGQRLLLRHLLTGVRRVGESADSVEAEATPALPPLLVQAMRSVLRHPQLDAGFKQLTLSLPSESYVSDQLGRFEPQHVHSVRQCMLKQLALALQPDWEWAFETHQPAGPYSPNAQAAGQRALANQALFMLCLAAAEQGQTVWPERALQRFKDARHMTNRLGALTALVHTHAPSADAALQLFYEQFQNEPLVIDTWFALQASAPEHEGRVFARALALMHHPDFSLGNPNRARSLIGTLCSANPSALHRTDGAGYSFWADRVLELNTVNPQLAARMARPSSTWAQLIEPYRSAALQASQRVAAQPGLSADVSEIMARTLSA